MRQTILTILALAAFVTAAYAVTCHETCYDIGGGMTSCTRTCH